MQHIDPIPHSLGDSDDDDDDEVCYTPSATTTHTSLSQAEWPSIQLPLPPSFLSASASAQSTSHRHDPPPSYLPTNTATIPASVAPYPGATFIIRARSTGLVIALKDGELGLYPDEKDSSSSLSSPITPHHHHGRGSHWQCIENDEFWLGFRSSVSGQYIGHNNDRGKGGKWRFVAKETHHRGWEWFCARGHPDGGVVLLVKHNDGFRAMRAGGEGGRELVVVGKGDGEGTAWDFIRVC